MGTEVTATKLKYISKMYGALYYQERVVEELDKQPQSEYKPLPDIPPEPSRTMRNVLIVLCPIIIAIVLYQAFVLGTLWCVITALLGAMLGVPVLACEEDSIKKAEIVRNRAKSSYMKICEENERRKLAAPVQRRILEVIIQEYRNAQEKGKCLLSEACNKLGLEPQYCEYAYVCSLYQYLYTGQYKTIEEACNQLDAEKQGSNYFTNAAVALEQQEYAKMNQPVWVQELIEREKTVNKCVERLRELSFLKVNNKNLNELYGNALDYEVAKEAQYLCSLDGLSLDSLEASQVDLQNACKGV